MSEKRIKQIAALGAWALIQAYFLAFHFSWNNLIVMAVGLTVLAMFMLFGQFKDKTNVTDHLMLLLGITFLTYWGYYVVSEIVPIFAEVEDAGLVFSEQLAFGFENFFNSLEFNLLIWALAIGIFFLGRSEKHPLRKILCKYLFWTVLLTPCITLWSEPAFFPILLTVVPALAFALFDIFDYLRCNVHSNGGKWWYRLLMVLLVLTLIVKNNALVPFSQPGYVEYLFFIDGLKWHGALLLTLAFAGAGYIMWTMDRKAGEQGIGTDAFVFWNLGCAVVATFVLSKFHVGYWWLLAILYAIGFCYATIGLHPKKTESNAKKRKLSCLFVPVLTVVLVVLTVAGAYGNLIRAMIFLASVAGVAALWKHTDLNTEAWKDKAWFYTGILLAVALNGGAALWCGSRSAANLALLAGILVVCVAYIWFLSYQSGLLHRKSHVVRSVVVAVLVISCLCLCGKSGAEIKLVTDEILQTRQIEVTPNNEDVEIASVEYYWWENYLSLDEEKPQPASEAPLLGTETSPEGGGRLRVVVTDVNGVVTEKIFWMHTCQYVPVEVTEEKDKEEKKDQESKKDSEAQKATEGKAS